MQEICTYGSVRGSRQSLHDINILERECRDCLLDGKCIIMIDTVKQLSLSKSSKLIKEVEYKMLIKSNIVEK